MRCPACRIKLVPRQMEGVGYEHCTGCSGSWFPHAGLIDATDVHLSDLEEASPDSAMAMRAVEARMAEQKALLAAYEGRNVTQGDRPCAECDQPMVKKEFAIRSGVLIEKCPEHHGIWVEQGELEQIRAYRLERFRLVHERFEELRERERRERWLYNPFFVLARKLLGIGPSGYYDPRGEEE